MSWNRAILLLILTVLLWSLVVDRSMGEYCPTRNPDGTLQVPNPDRDDM